MKLYVVATNTDETYIVKAENENQAIMLANERHIAKFEEPCYDPIAYIANDYFEEKEIADLTLV